jgi:uncharacterized repeat protein (TIGR01451 family)
MKRASCYQALVLTTAVSMVHANAANAAGTVAGTNVQNTATVNFSVGGVAQTPVNSNTASFLVDRRVNLTVSEDGAVTTSVSPGSVNQVTKFILSNTTNDTLDFSLGVTQDAGGTAAHGGTDNFDASNVRVFVDNPSSGTVGSYDAADTLTYVDELAPDTTRAIFVVVDIPLARVNGDIAGVTLTATAAAGGTAATQGSDLTETVGGNTAGVDTLFDDGAGDTDAVRDGKSSDDDDYTVSAATITLNKTSRIISDPVRGTTNPLAIPGALIEYCIEVANTGSATATGIAFSDTLPTDVTWAAVSQNFRVGGAVSGGLCDDAGSVEDEDAAGADEADPNGGSHAAGVVSASLPSVAASTSATVKFRVTVD